MNYIAYTMLLLGITMLMAFTVNSVENWSNTKKCYLFLVKSLKLKWSLEFVKSLGVCWLFIEFVESMRPSWHEWLVINNEWLDYLLLIVVAISFIWATWRTLPKFEYHHEFNALTTCISIVVGDLFDQKGNIVIGSSDYLDSVVPYEQLNSLKGQLISKFFKADSTRFDSQIMNENPSIRGWIDPNKPNHNKNIQYPIGSVFKLKLGDRWVLIPVIANLMYNSNDVSKINSSTTISNLHKSLEAIWKLHNEMNQVNAELSMPVLGSGLAKLQLNRQALIQYIILSYLTKSREMHISKHLNIVIYKDNYDPEEMTAVIAFLDSLKV
jgi:hypothetical protein